ncbi:hypothetical protein SERLADRAFT_387650 [Serpula lacrymans var. lacrymans S7.9]|nr:uncharacterized protein SERLADRAFT_387650 [Serpula lacrymans var. lacrymans S7.9]EGO25538.1 hypothetical protein SERLADRAFT_387650 [Serpula lacrymans var. lacrymans S7.9]
MQGEALCALSCIQFSAVLCIGSLIYRLWRGGWWVDSATAILIALLFGWEGQKMVKWARDAAFDGGCCGHCKTVPGSRSTVTGDSKDSEVAISDSHEVISATSPVSERCTGNDSCGISDTSHVHASEVAK